jgi:hypothetical protein
LVECNAIHILYRMVDHLFAEHMMNEERGKVKNRMEFFVGRRCRCV